MNLNRTENPIDRIGRNRINDNWDIIERNFNDVVNVVSNEAYEQVVDAAKLIWKAPVDDSSLLTTTYPDAEEGWASMARDTGIVYRYYENGGWKPTLEITVGPVNEVDERLSDEITNLASLKPSGDTTGVQDTAAILQRLNDNGFVDIGEGTFYIRHLAIDKQAAKIKGRGIRNTILQSVGTSDFLITISETINVENCLFEDLEIRGHSSDLGGVKFGTLSTYTAFATFNRVSIRNFTGVNAKGVEFVQTQEVEFNNCKIHYNYINVYRGSAGYMTITTFSGADSYIGRATTKGIWQEEGQLRLLHCVLESNGEEAYYNPSGKVLIDFTQCYFEMNNRTGGLAQFTALGSATIYNKAVLRLMGCELYQLGSPAIPYFYVDNADVTVEQTLNLYMTTPLATDTTSTNWQLRHNNNNNAVRFEQKKNTLNGRVFAQEFDPSLGTVINYASAQRGNVFDGHMVSIATSKPSINVGPGMGTGASATVSNRSTDISGQVTVILGSSGWATTGGQRVFEIIPVFPYNGLLSVQITPGNAFTAAFLKDKELYADTDELTKVVVRVGQPVTQGGTLKFNYLCTVGRSY